MAVDEQLSDVISGFLFEVVDVPEEAREVVSGDDRREDAVANASGYAAARMRGAHWQESAIFFVRGVKNCAKFARDSLDSAKFEAQSKRLRSALAACFFGDFCFFPLLVPSVKTSTTPHGPPHGQCERGSKSDTKRRRSGIEPLSGRILLRDV